MGRKSSKYSIEGVGSRESASGFPFFKIGFFIAIIGTAIFPFTTIGNKVIRKVGNLLGGEVREIIVEVPVEKIVEVRVEVPVEVHIPVAAPAVRQEKVLANSHAEAIEPMEDVRKMSSSSRIKLSTSVKADKSNGLASADRTDDGSYAIEYKVLIKVPKAAATLAELEKGTPGLGEMLPKLGELTKTAKVSPYFYEIYKNKVDRVKRDATKMKSLLSRHNFFDLQTVLNMTAPNGRKVMIMQADMDVVSDGSDGDRLAKMPESIVNSTYYQPSTSYFWKKQTSTPNPMVAGYTTRVKKGKAELANPATTSARKTWLKDRLKMLETKIQDMKYFSYLVAEYDPFIVIPISMLTNMSDKHAPKVGDYAVVIYKDKLYPCIVGDGGPTFKVGEASLRMAKELNKRAGIYSRPVSDLSVTYLVFPNSRNRDKSAPDYTMWRTKCSELLKEIGGLSAHYQLHEWTNKFPKKDDATTR